MEEKSLVQTTLLGFIFFTLYVIGGFSPEHTQMNVLKNLFLALASISMSISVISGVILWWKEISFLSKITAISCILCFITSAISLVITGNADIIKLVEGTSLRANALVISLLLSMLFLAIMILSSIIVSYKTALSDKYAPTKMKKIEGVLLITATWLVIAAFLLSGPNPPLSWVLLICGVILLIISRIISKKHPE